MIRLGRKDLRDVFWASRVESVTHRIQILRKQTSSTTSWVVHLHKLNTEHPQPILLTMYEGKCT